MCVGLLLFLADGLIQHNFSGGIEVFIKCGRDDGGAF